MESSRRRRIGIWLIAAAVTMIVVAALSPVIARAQAGAAGTGYSALPAGPSYPAVPPPNPPVPGQDEGSSFSIPIPGGGEIQVNGPKSEPPDFPPTTETWSATQNNPNSIGGAPMGPVTPHPH
jgi:hypothetical protein